MSRKNMLLALAIGMAASAGAGVGSAGVFRPDVCQPARSVPVCKPAQAVPVCKPVTTVPACGPVQTCGPVRARESLFVARTHRLLAGVKNRFAAHYWRHHGWVDETAPATTRSVNPAEHTGPAPAMLPPAPPVSGGT